MCLETIITAISSIGAGGGPAALAAGSAGGAHATFAAAQAASAAASTASTLSAIGTGASLLGTGLSAYGQYQQGKYAEAVARHNAKIGELRAVDALERGKTEEKQHRLRIASTMGEQRASVAGAGFDVGYGSALDVLGDTAYFGEMDALTIRANSEREAWGYRQQAQGDRIQGSIARSAGTYNAGGTVLGGAGTVAKKWYSFGA